MEKNLAFIAVITMCFSTAATSKIAPLYRARPGTSIPNQYIVVLKDEFGGDLDHVLEEVENSNQLRKLDARVTHVYSNVYRGFSLHIPETALLWIRKLSQIAYVEEDCIITAQRVPWNLDRIDQRDLPLNSVYMPAGDGEGVNVYVVDTGIRYSHEEYSGRASFFYDYETDGDGSDCNGHGTHGAGVVGGTDFGVAIMTSLYSVRVLSCFGAGSTSQIIAGIDYIAAWGVRPGVASISIGGGPSTSLDNAVRGLVAAGFSACVSAGGAATNACNFSPARVEEAITVGSMDSNDYISSSSNTGPCIDMFAPGVDIQSAWHTSDTATAVLSGTSSSTAHVAGACAIILEENPTWSPKQVVTELIENCTKGRLQNVPDGTYNRIVYT
uniref:Proteinase K-like n=1 Tax=Saccoglossus kowalevskii TaxID=10224 RepID=A0ABM0MS86_SACKO